jgi:hypothetical protein
MCDFHNTSEQKSDTSPKKIHFSGQRSDSDNERHSRGSSPISRDESPSSRFTRASNIIQKPLSSGTPCTGQQQNIHLADKHIQSSDETKNSTNCNKNDEDKTKNINISRIQRRKRYTEDDSTKRGNSSDGTTRTSTNKRNSSNDKTDSTHTKPIPSTSLDAHSSDSRIYYTFIIHKTNTPKIPSPRSTKAPTFAAFDHGDHYHFIFGVTHSNNTNRSLNHILQFIKTSFPGTAEAHTTLQPIRLIQRFLHYLVRKGLSTFHKYGIKPIPILNSIISYLATTDQTDTSSLEPCSHYIEEKKEQKQETIKQRTFFH